MSNSYFFIDDDDVRELSVFKTSLKKYAGISKVQVYVIRKPLGENKYSYDYKRGLVVMVPNHKIMILDFGGDREAFDDYSEDFIEDLASISDKYNYKNIIGRVRKWREEVVYVSPTQIDPGTFSIKALFNENRLPTPELCKKAELIISLLTGSINDIERVKGGVPDNLLDKIKQKILLFDGDQTRFVYNTKVEKKVTIQGLSGTGKTELLLHKLKEIYLGKPGSKILFTCHNKILASNLKTRIPSFFNFMKVEEQIEWDSRLWCSHAWGSRNDYDSGAYRYICWKYGIPFHTFSYSRTFSDVCTLALEQISAEMVQEVGYAYNYVLIDESQDFPKSFISLCERVTDNTIYIAGDIFQSIFDENVVNEIQPDYLLSKCYRTDPRTLMFAHGLGMGLFEATKLRWLNDEEWGRCGYIVNKSDSGAYKLSREPLRRFEDLNSIDHPSMELVRTNEENGNGAADNVIRIMKKIREENPTVSANDIGIIFLDGNKVGYRLADVLEVRIAQEIGWTVNKAYDTKIKVENQIFISNKNNVKGLEFPFVICINDYISDALHERNALYMVLTRSFIQTFLLVNDTFEPHRLAAIETGLENIQKNGYMSVTAPNALEQENLRTKIEFTGDAMTIMEITEAVFDELDVPPLWRSALFGVVKTMDQTKLNYENVKALISVNLEKMDID
jgi:superfamily I DNA and RNA helicase